MPFSLSLLSPLLSLRISHSLLPSASTGIAKGDQPLEVDGVNLNHEDERKARVLYDFDAENEGQISVTSDQVWSCERK